MGVSINDLRKNLRDLNEYMDKECGSTTARYGVLFDASLITGIDPPAEVESALAGDQYRLQPGIERHQPGARRSGSKDCPVQARRGD
jgi:hypothetical protein